MNRIVILGLLGLALTYFFFPKVVFKYYDKFIDSVVDTPTPSLSSRVLAGLNKQTSNAQLNCSRVAIGYNANLDLIVKATELMHALNVVPAASADHTSVASLDDFQEVFSYYLSTGSAVERIVDSADVFQHIVQAAVSLQNKSYSTGGNAALMANRLATEGCGAVLLGGSVGNTLSSLLHPSVEVIKGEGDVEVKDEVHLIAEYPTGAKWGTHESPRANRIIITKDETNAKLSPLEAFHKRLPAFDPSLVVVSGLHLLEGQPAEFRKERVEKMLLSLDALPSTDKDGMFVAVHLELASIGSVEYLKEIAESAVPKVDSLGLNEQELGGVYLATGGKEYTVDDFKSPTVRTVVDAIKHILDIARFHSKSSKHTRDISRIHFHCLHFHLVVQKKISMWRKGLVSVAAGSLASSRQACDNEGIFVALPDTVEVGVNRNVVIEPDSPATAWREGDIEYYLAPVLVCKKALRTVGLGDAISAVGLVYHERKTQKKQQE